MKKNNFVDYVVGDLLADVDGVTSRSMFGGYGLYRHGKIFAMIVDDVLYFKVDEASKPEFAKYGSKPFEYAAKNGKKVAMSYWELPEEIMEDKKELIRWVDRSCAIQKKK